MPELPEVETVRLGLAPVLVGNRFASIEQRRTDLRALAYQHQRFGILKPLAQRVDVLYVIIPDLDVVARQFAEAAKRAQSVVIVVEYRNSHDEHQHLVW